jgi:hypothetical protein
MGYSGKKLDRVKKIENFSKIVRLKRLVRERNWVVVKIFGFLQKW